MNAINTFIATRDFYNNNKAATEFAQKMAMSIYDTHISGGCSEAEALDMALRVVAVHEEDATATYECYCQECDATLDMTEEEFEDDDELKLCDSCQANSN